MLPTTLHQAILNDAYLTFDSTRHIGTGRLLQSYGIHKTMREARTRGLRVLRKQEQDGSALLTLEGGAL